MKNLCKVLFAVLIIFLTSSYAYEEKGKIDMHGGKSDKIIPKIPFGTTLILDSILEDDKKNKDKKDIQKSEQKKVINK